MMEMPLFMVGERKDDALALAQGHMFVESHLSVQL